MNEWKITPSLVIALALTAMPFLTGVNLAQQPKAKLDHGGLGKCAERVNMWHPPVIDGCETGHEHGDAPPRWLLDWARKNSRTISFHGAHNTSPVENVSKHACMKGYEFRANRDGAPREGFVRLDAYFIMHACSTPSDRASRFHSIQYWIRHTNSAVQTLDVSYAAHWYNSGDPRFYKDGGSRVDERVFDTSLAGQQRPAIRVALQTDPSCEQWYPAPGEPGWSIDLSLTICNSATAYTEHERLVGRGDVSANSIYDLSKWQRTGGKGDDRQLEAIWYSQREHPSGYFWTNQFGDVLSIGETPPPASDCTGKTERYSARYDVVCLRQYLSPRLESFFIERRNTWDATGVAMPN